MPQYSSIYYQKTKPEGCPSLAAAILVLMVTSALLSGFSNTARGGTASQNPYPAVYFDCQGQNHQGLTAWQDIRCHYRDPSQAVSREIMMTEHRALKAAAAAEIPGATCFSENHSDRLEIAFETICTVKDQVVFIRKTVWPIDTRARIYYRARTLQDMARATMVMIKIRNRYDGRLPQPKSLLY